MQKIMQLRLDRIFLFWQQIQSPAGRFDDIKKMWWKQAHAHAHTRRKIRTFRPRSSFGPFQTSRFWCHIPAPSTAFDMRYHALKSVQGCLSLKNEFVRLQDIRICWWIKGNVDIRFNQKQVFSVCVYVCIFVRVCVFVRVVCVCESVHMYMRVYECIYMRERKSVCARLRGRVYTCGRACLVFVCVYTNSCVSYMFSSRKPLSHEMQRKNNPTYTRVCTVFWNRLHLAFGKESWQHFFHLYLLLNNDGDQTTSNFEKLPPRTHTGPQVKSAF